MAAVNPLAALADTLVRAAPAGHLVCAFARTSAGDYNPRTDAAPTTTTLHWSARGYWGKVPFAIKAQNAAEVQTATARPLMVAGASLTPPIAPLPGDVVVILGQRFTVTAVSAVAAPGGGIAPLYRCEVG